MANNPRKGKLQRKRETIRNNTADEKVPRKQAERKLLSSLDRTRETNPLASPASPAARLCNLPASSAARGVDRGIPPGNAAQHTKRPAGATSPRGPLSAQKEKRPPRARRPALPQPSAAVLSAKAGLTAGFGMGPGDPRLCGRARGGRSPAAQMYSSLPGTPVRGDPGGRMAGTGEDRASRSVL